MKYDPPTGLDISPIERECKCGTIYNPRWLDRLNKYASVCGKCAFANLEKFLSEPDYSIDKVTDDTEQTFHLPPDPPEPTNANE